MFNSTAYPEPSAGAFGFQYRDAAGNVQDAAAGSRASAYSALGRGAHGRQEEMGPALDIGRKSDAIIAASVSGMASYVGQKAEDPNTTVRDGIENTVHCLNGDVLNRLDSAVTELLRRNPISTILVGIDSDSLFTRFPSDGTRKLSSLATGSRRLLKPCL